MTVVATPMFDGKRIAHVNALLVQPTSHCMRNCNGCYAKTFRNSDNRAIDHFFKTLSAASEFSFLANQITFAVDSLRDENNRSLKSEADLKMITAFLSFVNYADYCRAMGVQTEFHITAHNVRDFMVTMGRAYSTITFDMVSLSSINIDSDLASVRNFTKALNWNLTIDDFMEKFIEKEILDPTSTYLETILARVDSCYLILHKPSTGLSISPDTLALYLRIQERVKLLPPELKAKVHTDTCIKDSEKFNSTGFGCSANVSKFQLWPDGSITGCPYNQNRVTEPATEVSDIFKNFALANQTYEFKNCKIPVAINPTNPYHVAHKLGGLEIIE